MSKGKIMWGAKEPDSNKFCCGIWPTKKEAMLACVEWMEGSVEYRKEWRKLYRIGFRIQKVEVIEHD